MKKYRNIFPIKEQNKASEKDLNKITYLIMFKIKMLTQVRRTSYEQSEIFNRDRKYKRAPNRNHVTKEYNNETEKCNRRFNRRLDDTEERFIKLKHRAVICTQSEEQKEKEKEKEVNIVYSTHGPIPSSPTFTL